MEEVQEYKNKLDMQDKIKEFFQKTSVEAFEEWLTLKDISFSENSLYTEREWYSYCKQKLSLSESSNKGMRNLIKSMLIVRKFYQT